VDTAGAFDVYGRIIYRPFASTLPTAEFHLFHEGKGITDAIITLQYSGSPTRDTIPLMDSTGGVYSSGFPARIDDTLSYSIKSQYGTQDGIVIIPDSVLIIRPLEFDTLTTGGEFPTIWHRGSSQVDGYFVYLEGQGGFVAAVTISQFDTTNNFSGENVVEIGSDRFWVEAMRGPFSPGVMPNGRIMPKGVVGSAGTFRDVYVVIR
jgi:hypothetical protein